MSPQRLTAAPLVGLEALAVFNKPVFEAHAELIGLVRQRRGPLAADAFAGPEWEGDHLVWTTDLPGTPRRWADLSLTEQAGFDAGRLSLGETLGGLVAELMRSGPNTRFGNFGQMLHAATEIPGPEHLFVVGDALVLTFWGFRSAGGSRFDPFAPGLTPVEPPPRPPSAAPSSRFGRRLPWLLRPLLVLTLMATGMMAWWLWPPSAPSPSHAVAVSTPPVEPDPAQTPAAPNSPPPSPLPSPATPKPSEAPPPVLQPPEVPAPRIEEPVPPVLEAPVSPVAPEAPVDEPPLPQHRPPPPAPPPAPPASPSPATPSSSASPPLAPQVDLPKDRWDHNDLTMMEGCWILGRAYITTYDINGVQAGLQKVHAQRLCFDSSGHGSVTEIMEGLSGPEAGQTVECSALLSGHFEPGGSFTAYHNPGRCSNRFQLHPNSYRCFRQNDGTALCNGEKTGQRQMWFRRADHG